MTETELEEAIGTMCAELDVMRFHVPDSRRMRQRGLPDDFLVGTYGVLWRECKQQGESLSPAQRKVAVRLLQNGQSFAIWRPSDLRSGLIRAELTAISTIGKR